MMSASAPSIPTEDALPGRYAAALRGVAVVAYLEAELDALEAPLRRAPHWRPSTGLLAQIGWSRERIRWLAERLERRLVVAIVGPSGAGKSTLLNALAGRSLSPVGLTRPTTRQVVVYARSLADADELQASLGDAAVRVEIDAHAPGLEHLVFVDTPDTNTLPENQELLTRLLPQVDVLVPVFSALNPRLLDNIAFLRSTVQHLPTGAVFSVLNWADRVPQTELQKVIVPDVRRLVSQEWGLAEPQVFVVSARASLSDVTYSEDEQPLHGWNEFSQLRARLLQELNRSVHLADQRLAHAERLLALVKEAGRVSLASARASLIDARPALVGLATAVESRLQQTALVSFRTSSAGLDTALYARLAARWWGPVGWLVAAWSLLLRVIETIGRTVRRPRGGTMSSVLTGVVGLLDQSLPAGDSLRPAVHPEPAVTSASAAALSARTAVSAPLEEAGSLILEQWPPIADAMVRAGYDPHVRDLAPWKDWLVQRAGVRLAAARTQQHESARRTMRVLSAWPTQLLANAPILSLLGWVCYQTISRFLEERYLPADYFRHAGIVALLVWLASFVAFQAVVSLAMRASSAAQVRIGIHSLELGPWHSELEALEALRQACE